MAKLLNIGLYCKNGWMENDDSVAHRLQDLSDAIDTAFDTIGPTVPVPVGAPALPLNIFVAPEYLFKKNDHRCKTGNQISSYTVDEKDQILAALGTLSASRPNFLLIGGSVFWYEALQKKHWWNKQPRDEVHNTVAVFHDGNLLLSYDKMNDCGELSPEIPAEAKKQTFVRGLQHGLFTCDGLQCGVETCLDHDKGELHAAGTNLDIHFVASNTVSVTASKVACGAGGLVIQANACPPRQAFGNNVYVHPFAWDSKHAVVNQGQVGFTRFVLP
ncbi:hypothetical protein ACPOLB_09435 [Rubrivivax sp. RP6-9]|uniref:hypothetical protein n=1 Tax=Rubrivivax sp. RP6-9 TaxID=3415750 RepID=UPI003CC5D1CC